MELFLAKRRRNEECEEIGVALNDMTDCSRKKVTVTFCIFRFIAVTESFIAKDISSNTIPDFHRVGAAMELWRPVLTSAHLQFKRMVRYVMPLGLSFALAACVSVPQPKPLPRTQKPAPRPAIPAPKPKPAVPQRSAALSPELGGVIREQWRVFPGRSGIAILSIDGGGQAGERMDELFPQQSVSKIWVAMTVLDQVDQGRLRLDQNVRITRDDLVLFHQPTRARVLAEGEVNESVGSLLEQAITASDNLANDSLLRTAGGPEAVRSFIARHNLGAIRFGPGERLLQSATAGITWKQEYSLGDNFFKARRAVPYAQRKAALDRYLADPPDGASPGAIAAALGRLAKGELLSAQSTRLLMGILERTRTGPNRLKAGVPADWTFIHKTGTGQELDPVSTGYNDIGIMTAPDGSRYAVVVMLGNTTAPIPDRMAFMQSISRAVANYHRR